MSDKETKVEKKQTVQIKVPEDIARGVYANSMGVFHTREEFVLDFLNMFPFPRKRDHDGQDHHQPGSYSANHPSPAGKPSTLRRSMGPVQEAPPPYTGPMGYA